MFIKSLEITKYTIFKKLNLEFKFPKNKKNVINLLIGNNGIGKTQILNIIKDQAHFIQHDAECFKTTFAEFDNYSSSYKPGPKKINIHSSLNNKNSNELIENRFFEDRQNHTLNKNRYYMDNECRNNRGSRIFARMDDNSHHNNNTNTFIYIPSKVFHKNLIIDNPTTSLIKYYPNGKCGIKKAYINNRVLNHITENQSLRFYPLNHEDSTSVYLKSYTLEEDSIDETILQLERLYYDITSTLEIEDPIQRKIKAISILNQKFAPLELDTIIKEISNGVIFFTSKLTSYQKFKFHELSSGEQQLYTKFTILIAIEPECSIIVIDEPELSLHPTWQIRFIKMLKTIGEANQFILATHSPYMINNLTNNDSLITLDKKADEIIAHNDYRQIERDINTVLTTVMGLKNIVPEEVQRLREEYKKYVENNLDNTSDADKILKELLKYESMDSSFLQEMNLIRLFRS